MGRSKQGLSLITAGYRQQISVFRKRNKSIITIFEPVPFISQILLNMPDVKIKAHY